MKFNDKTPRKALTIAGKVFQVASPFKEGDTVNPNEANALNQVLAENVRNNLAKQVKENEAFSQADVDAYVKGYAFGVRTIIGRALDPVAKEAMVIAREKVREAIVKKGLKLKDIGSKRVSELAANALEKHPEWLEAATQTVELRQKTAAAAEVEISL